MRSELVSQLAGIASMCHMVRDHYKANAGISSSHYCYDSSICYTDNILWLVLVQDMHDPSKVIER